ncbi:hypothetical protein Afil01_38610 [Actinorhabdospora filicis]|uniref:PH domain-containing protein n=1 Tax=Actinorhabdospora filicis TaxID=1785913 RepID=A0A9W6W9W3_9ACTN|nr:hypothetical protein [Actinorhabdospora filicis]GLZ79054.1 hypothetical protein Afil01_38610 [Actinorhabdospora filicis]
MPPKYRVGRAQGSWAGEARARTRTAAFLTAAGACALAAALIGFLPARIVFALIAVACAVRAAAGRRVRLEMDLYSVRVRFGILPASVVRLPLRTIRSVHAGEARRGRALLRPGPAVVFTLVSGRTLPVSVPDPEAARVAYERIRAKHG